MNLYQTEDMQWVAQRLKDRVSYTGWSFAILSGLWLWALIFRFLL